ncbi:ornithine carbamoyltransferase [Bacillus sp. FJAT-47783]|uniref:ornithine carbamoyltransferase n=1 Tax=Bacillus sp. FJAT-47783 TaxID=2922712 RepID=UPI001FAC3040|nr:ornithine carbamoyltransferase [Bacillus sp. FJAT-47783]
MIETTKIEQVKHTFTGKDVLTLLPFSSEEILYLLEEALTLKKQPYSSILQGKTLAMIFEKSSTRTRVSFEVGMLQLGGHAIDLNANQLQLGRGETIADTAKVLSSYVDAILIRSTSHDRVKELANYASVPVINGLCDIYHPCQAMADLLTILELKGTVKGVNVTYVGDGNNVAHSLMIGAAKVGMNFSIATPIGFEPNEDIVQKAQEIAKETGACIQVEHDPIEAVKEADIIYTDVWTSMGQEEEAEKRKEIFKPYQVNESLMKAAKSDAHFLHCLPAHREEEVTAAVIDGPQSAVFQQAENRLHAQKAILKEILV